MLAFPYANGAPFCVQRGRSRRKSAPGMWLVGCLSKICAPLPPLFFFLFVNGFRRWHAPARQAHFKPLTAKAGLSLVPALTWLLENVGRGACTLSSARGWSPKSFAPPRACVNFFMRNCFPTLAVVGYQEATGSLGGLPRETFAAECLVFLLCVDSTPHSRSPSIERQLQKAAQTERGACPLFLFVLHRLPLRRMFYVSLCP